ncbi:Hypothetical predicted protein [Olea europaea subsp. europaea]|uniref:Uncharacterized protein n=1 Tax=Olea europaea subsp. europaea TaxID=158383 RepID=A0A8S0RQ90_OLEEU|nr:Hypothetical predicted protein [Olea europaea subsp. europaea]
MPYMTEVGYDKLVLPDRSRGEKRKGGSTNRSVHRVGNSTKPSDSGIKQSIPMLLITVRKLGPSDVHIDDDDFLTHYPVGSGHQSMEILKWEVKKFNDKDDAIRPPFSVGQYLVGNKTWWYGLVSREVSLTSSVTDDAWVIGHMYSRSQYVLYGKHISAGATV